MVGRRSTVAFLDSLSTPHRVGNTFAGGLRTRTDKALRGGDKAKRTRWIIPPPPHTHTHTHTPKRKKIHVVTLNLSYRPLASDLNIPNSLGPEVLVKIAVYATIPCAHHLFSELLHFFNRSWCPLLKSHTVEALVNIDGALKGVHICSCTAFCVLRLCPVICIGLKMSTV